MTSEGKMVDVGCKYLIYYIIISVQRKHNGQQAVHMLVCRQKIVTSENRTVDLRCKYYMEADTQ